MTLHPKHWRRLFGASLSLKLVGIFVGGSVLFTVLIGVVSQFGFERHFFSTARPLLNHYVHFLSQELGSPPDIQRAANITQRWPLTIRIFDDKRGIRWASDGLLRPPRVREQHGKPSPRVTRSVYWDRGTVFLGHQAGSSMVYYGLRLRPRGLPWFPLVFISLVLLGLWLFYALTRRLFAPIKTIEAGIVQIGQGQLEHRITTNRHDELGVLAEHVNQMAAQLQTLLQAKRDLLLALSHELKSPLARSRVTLALLDDCAYKQALLDDQQQMQGLIDQIIEAERKQGIFATLQREPTDIHALIKDVCSSFDRDAVIEINCSPATPLVAVDAAQIKRLLRNLVENSLRYNDAHVGPVSVSCHVDQRLLRLTVKDFGPGIAAEHISRLTEAFYRADPSRERKTGGFGLGLYLAQAVINAHQGELFIHSQVGKGTQLECVIPLPALNQ